MYRKIHPDQLSFDFKMPFGKHLDTGNRWYQIANIIPWEDFSSRYESSLCETMGAPSKPFRIALGALLIQALLSTSDRETVAQIQENPYLQYFLGLEQYSKEALFDVSMMVHFRKRISSDIVNEVNKFVVTHELNKKKRLFRRSRKRIDPLQWMNPQ